eukprot:gene13273-biopygen11568
MKSIIVFLAVLNFGYMALDGSRALVTGSYIAPSSGEYKGRLGPWSKLVSAVGIEPEGKLMKTIFVVWGIVGLAADGVELLQKLEEGTVLPDVCMLDISMPRMDGFATAEAIRDTWPEVRVLVVTVHAEDLYFARMIAAGAKGYVTKDARAE